MTGLWTTRALADELEVSQRRLATLAAYWGWTKSGVTGLWEFTDEQAERIRTHVRAWDSRRVGVARGCEVEGCGGEVVARGLCSAHYQRLRRHGSLEDMTGAHQREKIECPQGHRYTPENALVSGGRRWCRTCKRERERVG